LGVVGDPAVTGKSASSDVRAGKSSAPIIAAARGEGSSADELRAALAAGVPEGDDEVARIRGLVEAAGGVTWATDEADRLLAAALAELDELRLPGQRALAEIAEVARYLVTRDH
jgi:geranylgeranyl diphosphate synthase type I